MPPWGRPPGARMGRNTRGRAAWGEARVEEVDSDEDGYGRDLIRGGRYTRGLDYEGRGPRRRPAEYVDLSDDSESADGGDFDLYDQGDSTVAYAMQLAMRDKEDQLVDQALERIRRAQMLGKKNVRLSKRELDALERKRQQVDNLGGTRRPKQGANPPKASSRPSSRRSAAGFPPEQSAAYPPFAPDPFSTWARGSAGGPGRPSSSSSATGRPRTPTTQSLRPQQSNSPLRPPYPQYPPERFAPNGRPQTLQQPPMYQRPLPDDPQWAPSYYNQMQMSPYGEPAPYQPQLPTDLRAGLHGRMSYPSGAPYQAQQSPQGKRPSQGTTQAQDTAAAAAAAPASVSAESESGSSSEEESESSSEDEVQIVKVTKVAERPAAPVAVPRRRTVSGGRGGARKRTSR
ncbi:uncharacterized protein N7515_006177 [Penicillium bovifimosum]|uniref:Prenylated Rab acceptor 1 n=1 Tax=Penicillium bovifimosum TaxID=126998 RepID=A0A9W9GUG2_9EURO|nr:uncharacterized protein N7515_006177 [Penicillium bovifimosum]KAJ5130138.1 hypothetical protein N7515_006177 [Penicillium bovifimosum]